MEVSSNASLFRQGISGTNQLAYMTPKWNNLYAKVAVVTPKNDNGKDVDVFGLRLLYVTDNFDFVANRAEIDENMLPGNRTTPYVRYALSSSFTYENFYLGGLVEFNIDDPQGDSNIYGLSGSYSHNQMTFKLGVQQKDFDAADKNDETLYMFNATYAFDEHFYTYIELADYSEAGSGNGNNNVSLGFNFKF
jgi:hypothetical protein